MIANRRPSLDLSDLLAVLRPWGGRAEFERAVAYRAGAKHGLAFSYARSGFYALLHAMDLRGAEIIVPGAVVLARTGWASRWGEGSSYYNRGEDGRLHFPGFGVDAARFLVEERDIGGIGIDTGSVDPGNADGFPVNRNSSIALAV